MVLHIYLRSSGITKVNFVFLVLSFVGSDKNSFSHFHMCVITGPSTSLGAYKSIINVTQINVTAMVTSFFLKMNIQNIC